MAPKNFIVILIIAKVVYTITEETPTRFFDSSCFLSTGDCPNENITFWLYTNETRENPIQLNALNLNPSLFQEKRPLKILLHGYTGHRDFAPNTYIRPALLDTEDVYVISIDYGPLVREPCYIHAVQNLPLAAKCLAQLVNNLVNLKIIESDDIHIIGFSLGAQLAGQTSNYLEKKLKRITGLDPAKPLFITVGSDRKLDPTDAEFVDVIHTDVLGRGMLHTLGHADFYPNIGPYQPGCRNEFPNDPGSCKHERATRFYAESIWNKDRFWSYACPSWLHKMFGLCETNSNDAVMGYHITSNTHGVFFLQTANSTPYALGPIDQTTKKIKMNDLSYYNVTNLFDVDFEPYLRQSFISTLEALEEYDNEYEESTEHQ